MAETHLEMRRITKRFPGLLALDEVTMKVNTQEIHALVGENGAGKSTLMNILSGVYPYGSYEGEIILNGNECRFKDIRDSEKFGIVIIHQELALIPYLSIAENIFLGNEQAKNSIIDWNKTSSRAMELLKVVGLNENPATLVSDIGVGKQQMVEIAKALAKDVRLLILDEPTAALNDEESNKLLDLLLELKQKGITSILISHKLNEVEQVADAITVIRDGKVIDNLVKGKDTIDEDRIIKSMVGRDIVDRFPSRTSQIGEVVFEVKEWTVYHPQHNERKVIKNASFNVRKGEVVGFAGLMGAGRTELAMSLFGKSYGQKHQGSIVKAGNEVVLNSVSDAIDNGIAYMTEDRKGYGLVLIDDIRHNITLPSLQKVSEKGVLNSNEEIISAEKYRKKITIKCSGIDQMVDSLSGGNQQKVVLGKWIMAEPEVLILDEPTRGIDVGAKYEIYQIINQLALEGKSIIMISSEMPELLGMCDRIYVVAAGEIAGELQREEASQESIMKIIMTHQKRAKEITV
ncbi:multiple monosaccharide ABC transporter ATP-binding protein [Sediminispirochaeta bajacaliforniensis]|uniref:multiple monosaccharide ABC transporter ATP-binding protein n=1 Tax=Sediminispirochaeta bajacaliforniensis TaxID=148 RepID=UPI000476EB42|nr:multiple monosaccharide ABC transporter ATP-binding protein [Sediminispirochaeta bajacaliforniensis]